MKTQRNILIAFILNLLFSLFEFAGGIFTGSVAIMSDALHDMGDAASIGFSYFLEKKSLKSPDKSYTYGYRAYSVLGGMLTTCILGIGSVAVIFNAVGRIINPTPINYNGMIIFAVIGAAVNLCAAYFTREGDSLNQRAVNLHMLEDVLGWIVVLIGAVVMRFTNFYLIDPLMSIAVAVFILINAFKNLKSALNVFLWKTPEDISVDEIREHILAIDGISDVHHIHIWSVDGEINYATMHIVTGCGFEIKQRVREELAEHGIAHATLELEAEGENCSEHGCCLKLPIHSGHHHHHHH